MKRLIVGDSCTDLNQDLRKSFPIEIVPLRIHLGKKEFIDTKDFDSENFLKEMIAYEGIVKSSCPSPEDYLKIIKKDAEAVFIITLSKELSGSYNSAVLAKNIYLEEHGEKFIYVFNSKSASVGQTLIAMKIKECIDQGYENGEIVKVVEAYIETQETLFVLESLDNLIKNGRISKTKGFIANTFNIIPVMGSTPDGAIELKTKGRGSKAYKKMLDRIEEQVKEPESRVLGIAHVDNHKQAIKLKKQIEKRINFKKIIIVETNGVSTSYADNHGIILTY